MQSLNMYKVGDRLINSFKGRFGLNWRLEDVCVARRRPPKLVRWAKIGVTQSSLSNIRYMNTKGQYTHPTSNNKHITEN